MKNLLITAALLLTSAVTLHAQGDGMKDRMSDGMREHMMSAPIEGELTGVVIWSDRANAVVAKAKLDRKTM